MYNSTPEPTAKMLTTGQLSAFLKSDQAKRVPSGGTAQETTEAIRHTEQTLMMIGAELIQQGQAVDGFTFINIVFLPLNFFTSVFYLRYTK